MPLVIVTSRGLSDPRRGRVEDTKDKCVFQDLHCLHIYVFAYLYQLNVPPCSSLPFSDYCPSYHSHSSKLWTLPSNDSISYLILLSASYSLSSHASMLVLEDFNPYLLLILLTSVIITLGFKIHIDDDSNILASQVLQWFCFHSSSVSDAHI